MRILLVEDDPMIADAVKSALADEAHAVDHVSSGRTALTQLGLSDYQLVLLDLGLPGLDGMSVLRTLRGEGSAKNDIPVIILTARDALEDRLNGLDAGADDYLVKPFGMMEMVSRVRAVLRRCQKARSDTVLHAGNVCLNTDQRTVTADGEEVRLTYKEFEVLKLFMEHPGTVFTRDRLFGEVWGEDFVGETRTVDMHIRMLRQKLGESGAMIETVRNVGYRMSVRP